MLIISANQLQNDFDKYFDVVTQGEEILITINNIKVAKLAPVKTDHFLTDSLTGILSNDYDDKVIRKDKNSLEDL